MYYKTVLQSFSPEDTGDFMYRYLIHGRGYIIYSTSPKSISCLDLYSFEDLSPQQLAINKNVVPSASDEEEFSFVKNCTKADLINYLFDIQNNTGDLQYRGKSELCGYFLNEIKKPNKVRNFFQFNLDTKESSLLFDNDLCCKQIISETTNKRIHICWEAYVYYLLNAGSSNGMNCFLLPSSNLVLLSYVYSQILKREKEMTEPVEIELHVRNRATDILKFLSFYSRMNHAQTFGITLESGNIVVNFENWNPIDVMNFISKLQRSCNSLLNNKYEMKSNSHIFQKNTYCGFQRTDKAPFFAGQSALLSEICLIHFVQIFVDTQR